MAAVGATVVVGNNPGGCGSSTPPQRFVELEVDGDPQGAGKVGVLPAPPVVAAAAWAGAAAAGGGGLVVEQLGQQGTQRVGVGAVPGSL